MNDKTFNAGVATRTTINNSVSATASTAKAGVVAVASFFAGLIKGEQQPAVERTTRRIPPKTPAAKAAVRRATAR